MDGKHVHRTVAPDRQDLGWHTGRISNAGEQNFGVKHYPQIDHADSTLFSRCRPLLPLAFDNFLNFRQTVRLRHRCKAGFYALALRVKATLPAANTLKSNGESSRAIPAVTGQIDGVAMDGGRWGRHFTG